MRKYNRMLYRTGAIQADVLRFAAQLEKGAVRRVSGCHPDIRQPRLVACRGQHPCDEAMHWAVLRQALGEEPVPAALVG